MAKAKINVYQMVTDKIITALENGVIPWHKPWKTHLDNKSLAFNRVSKKPYSLLNQMLLNNGGEYATFKQWVELGGHIKQGAKSEFVVFWKLIEKIEKDEKTGEERKVTIPYLKYINVFHISCVEGVKPLNNGDIDTAELPPKGIEYADGIINEYVTREHITFNSVKCNEAYYSPLFDLVQVPCITQYDNVGEYYSTTFHELVHSTGHKSRLNRFKDNKSAGFGTQTYSKEELTAEIGSATILNMLNIENENTFNNSVAYIQNWLNVLRNDNKFIVSASGKAEKAVKLILNIE